MLILKKKFLKKIRYFDCHEKNVLIIDDNYEKINNLINLLKPYNLKIEIAHSYEDYEKKMYSGINWDLILLDDMMPDSHKFDFLSFNDSEKSQSLENIKSLTNIDLPLVIMLTPSDSIENMNGDYLIKPIKKDKLHGIISKYLK